METENASKKLGAGDALSLAKEATLVVVSKGRRVDRFMMQKDKPTDKTLLMHMLGPTGNLRAPTIRCGETLLVGFNDEVYTEILLT